MYFTYIVRCADNSLYTGFSTDVYRRVEEHNGLNKNGAKFTKAKGPVKLVYYETHQSKHDAMSREWHIKQLTKKQKEDLIMKKALPEIILASGSPRRKELLTQVGVIFKVVISDVDENIEEELSPSELVMELSKRKALAVWKENPGEIVLGADTVVAYDGEILGKPADEKEAFDMLSLLSGRTHQVFTGVTIVDKEGKAKSFFECTKVRMYDNKPDLLDAYIATKEPLDKAGAYGIQGMGAVLVESIEGDYNNVVGLPVSKVYKMLQELN